MTDRLTDHATLAVTIDRIYVVLRCSSIIILMHCINPAFGCKMSINVFFF